MEIGGILLGHKIGFIAGQNIEKGGGAGQGDM